MHLLGGVVRSLQARCGRGSFVTNDNINYSRLMAVKLDALPPFPGAGKPFASFIPFSDYSKWERRPIRRSEGKTRPKLPKESTSTVQWSSKHLPSVKSTKSSNTSTKLNPRSQESMKIVVLKVDYIAVPPHLILEVLVYYRMKWGLRKGRLKYTKLM